MGPSSKGLAWGARREKCGSAMSHWGGAGDQSHFCLAALGRDPCTLLQFAWSTFVVFITVFALGIMFSFCSLK